MDDGPGEININYLSMRSPFFRFARPAFGARRFALSAARRRHRSLAAAAAARCVCVVFFLIRSSPGAPEFSCELTRAALALYLDAAAANEWRRMMIDSRISSGSYKAAPPVRPSAAGREWLGTNQWAPTRIARTRRNLAAAAAAALSGRQTVVIIP